MPMSQAERTFYNEHFDPSKYVQGSEGKLKSAILRVLLSIDERLETTNEFYLQNQEERAQNGR